MIHIDRHDPHAALAADPSVLEPLWLALFDHHVATGAAGMPTRPRAGSWQQRRGHYLDTIGGSPQASLWIATDDGAPVGYALSFEDTLDGERVEVLESLSLLPETRGNGLGGELVAVVEVAAQERGIARGVIDVMGGNDRALRFYHRAGYAPYSRTWMRSEFPTGAVPDLGDLAEATARFAEIGVRLEATGHPDDTWETAASVATLAVTGTVADEYSQPAWWAGFDAGLRALGDAGYWTVWCEHPEASAWVGAGCAERGFHHGMTRVTRELTAADVAVREYDRIRGE